MSLLHPIRSARDKKERHLQEQIELVSRSTVSELSERFSLETPSPYYISVGEKPRDVEIPCYLDNLKSGVTRALGATSLADSVEYDSLASLRATVYGVGDETTEHSRLRGKHIVLAFNSVGEGQRPRSTSQIRADFDIENRLRYALSDVALFGECSRYFIEQCRPVEKSA